MADNDIFESVKRRSRDPRCGSCGGAEWMVQDGKYLIGEVVGADFAKSGIPVYAAVCAQCGFVRLYSTLIGD